MITVHKRRFLNVLNTMHRHKNMLLPLAVIGIFGTFSFILHSIIQYRQDLKVRALTTPATLSFTSTPLSNGSFSVSPILNTQGNSVSAADLVINFDKAKLSLTSITQQGNPVFKLFTPSQVSNFYFDTTRVISQANQTGRISFGIEALDPITLSSTGTFNGTYAPISVLTFNAVTGATGATTVNYVYDGSSTDSNVISTSTGSSVDVLGLPSSAVTVDLSPSSPSPLSSPAVSPTASSLPLGIPTPTPSPRPTATPTPRPSASASPVASAIASIAPSVAASSVAISSPLPSASPKAGIIALPGRFEAEDYIDYYDTTPNVNKGGVYRTDGVDIQACANCTNRYNVGWIVDGEDLEFKVNFAVSGMYVFKVRSATPQADKYMHVSLNYRKITPLFLIPRTGSWQGTWANAVSSPVYISAGTYTLTLDFDDTGFNVDSVVVEKVQ